MPRTEHSFGVTSIVVSVIENRMERGLLYTNDKAHVVCNRLVETVIPLRFFPPRLIVTEKNQCGTRKIVELILLRLIPHGL